MGASLSVDLSQVSVNESSRTATVSIVVKITSTAGTHNHYGSSDLGQGALLYVTIDGNTYSQYVTFGSSSTGTYTSTVYSNSITVSYSSSGTKTVSASARCVTGTSAGTISGSDSLSLTPIGSSSGGSGGDSGDDEDDGDDGGNTGGGSGGGYLVLPNFVGNTSLSYHGSRFPGWVGNDGWDYYASVIKFTTPEFSGKSTSVDIAIKARDNTYAREELLGAAICSSSANNEVYARASGLEVTDPYQIATGVIISKITSGIGQYGITNIPTTALKSSTAYYLILWIPTGYQNGEAYHYLDVIEEHVIRVNYSNLSTGCISTTSDFIEYEIHIDNGSSFDKYDFFIDTGTDWQSLFN